jgi:hypothetical protein
MGRGGPCSHECCSNDRLLHGILGLDAMQGRQEVLERSAAQGFAGLGFLAGGEGRETLLLEHPFRLVGEQHCIAVESDTQFLLLARRDLGRDDGGGRIARVQGLHHVGGFR